MSDVIRVTVWGEGRHEQTDPSVAERYPRGMHACIAEGIERVLADRVTVRLAALDDPAAGMNTDVIESTDVLVWWGHIAHEEVPDSLVDTLHERVLGGMGLVMLHSGHFSKLFRRLMGTTCSLSWRSAEDEELIWTVAPEHPIAAGVPSPILLPAQEMYGEFFDIPTPDELIFLSSFTGGEVFRSGCTFRRGFGRIFYFSPGDQDYPVYHNEDIQRVIANGVAWVAPTIRGGAPSLRHSPTAWFRP
jgi:trehalose utilization protein